MADLYDKPTIIGYNSSPPPDDDSQTSANAVSWAKHINKIGSPLKTYADAINDAVDTLATSLFGRAVTAISSAYPLTTNDYGKTFKSSNAITLTLLTGSDAGGNFVFSFYNSDAANNLTIARNGVNINGAASNLTIYPKQAGIAFSDGTDWWIFVFVTPDGKNTLSGLLTMSGKSIIEANASIAAHATTMDPWSLGNYVTLTGTAVTFTGIANAPQAGAEVELYMNAAHVFTNGAVFEVDGNQNYTATIGDRVLLRAKSTTVITVHPRKADGTSVVATTAATQADQETATSTTLMVTPGRQQYHPSAAKAWVNFNGTGTVAIRSSYNVSSITDVATGDYTVNMTNAFSDANYAPVVTLSGIPGVSRAGPVSLHIVVSTGAEVAPTTTAFKIVTTDSGNTVTDIKYVNVIVLGDQ